MQGMRRLGTTEPSDAMQELEGHTSFRRPSSDITLYFNLYPFEQTIENPFSFDGNK
jgi:hypothetical protein